VDPADASPALDYTDEEKAAMAEGITPEQIARRRVYYEDLRQKAAAKAASQAGLPPRPPDTFWTPVHPRGIVTIPRSLPIGLRQLVSLLLLILYPFWFVLVLCFFLPGIVLFAVAYVLFLPLRLSAKQREGEKAKKATRGRWPYDITWSRLDQPGPDVEAAEDLGTNPEHPDYRQATPPPS
jgi:hypothetical protein